MPFFSRLVHLVRAQHLLATRSPPQVDQRGDAPGHAFATHSSQMKTPFGPAIKRRTSTLSFPQNEQRYGLLALISLLLL